MKYKLLYANGVRLISFEVSVISTGEKKKPAKIRIWEKI